MSKARSSLYMCICRVLVERNVHYTLPPYFESGRTAGHGPAVPPARVPGEGAHFMPPFMTKEALKM